MIVIGVGSGTSMDGIDVAAADFSREGHVLTMRPMGFHEHPFPEHLRADLIAALPPNAVSMQQVCGIDTGLGQAFAEAVQSAVGDLPRGPELVASAGQTLYHWVQRGEVLGTLQLGQPGWIAERTGLPVVSDLRSRDVAAGGHGAPLAATMDALLLAGRRQPAAALNLGGIANISVLERSGRVLAYDTGPGNALLDAAVRRATSGRSDRDHDGAMAARGAVLPALLERLLGDPYFRRPPPKTTGKEYFHTEYLQQVLADCGQEPLGDDLVSTLTELTSVTVADACHSHQVGEVLASGGGTANPELMRRLATRLEPIRLSETGELGIPAPAKEAYLFALLGYLSWHGLAGTVPSGTGARHARVAGHITPGSAPLRLPEPACTTPSLLRVDAQEPAA